MEDITKIHPGDQITALGITATVWRILYQDHCLDSYDVEFIDDQGHYRHWKECYDGGTVTRSGKPGDYFLAMEDQNVIGAILPARQPGTYSARVITRSGNEAYLGRFSRTDYARARLESYAAEHNITWKEM